MRRLNRAVALIVGLALAVASVLAGIEIMELTLGNPPLLVPRHSWDSGLRTLQWGSFGLELTCVILVVVGVVLIALQLIRRRPVRLPLRSRPGQWAWVSRGGLARRLAFDVAELDEITSSKVRVGRSRVRTKVVLAAGTDRAAGVERVGKVAQETLRSIGMVHELKLRVVATSADPSVERPE
ncbi:MAG: DUF6286 domain-containing protein [Actinomycetota bacterium]|nr:DUF6286 domain-containing protein [Actinomycetota bacterium]